MKLGIIKDVSNRSNYYVDACKDLEIDYAIIDITSSNWIESVKSSNCDGFLVAPYSTKDVWKSMYIERLYFINVIMNLPIYPSYNEIFLYESKRNMAYWLRTKGLPTAKTWVFYRKLEAINFLENEASYPLIFKPNIGSAALGVEFLKSPIEAKRIVNKIFTKWKFFNRGYTKWYKTKYKISYPIMDDKQYNNVLFQEKIDVLHEWRGVKIGDSYFAHKKLPDTSGLHSGSGIANYDSPPLKVMDFIKDVCNVGAFRSMNVDFFEDTKGSFYINELQTIFGSQISPYQMCVNEKPGRYKFENNTWVFEEGMFNQNNSYNLRVEDFLKQLNSRKSWEVR